jgi:predicted amidophosphoribosyltransferase
MLDPSFVAQGLPRVQGQCTASHAAARWVIDTMLLGDSGVAGGPVPGVERAAWWLDRRANLVNRFHITPDGNGPGHRLHVQTAQDIVDQLVALHGPAYTPVRSRHADWTHELVSPHPVDPSVLQLLRLLSKVLTLHRPSFLNLALALAWYKEPAESGTLLNTEVGDLVHRAKYRWAAPREITTCGLALTDALVLVIEQHPLLSSADVVISVPGHDRDVVAFSQRLGSSVADTLSIDHVRVGTVNAQRPEAKALTPDQRRRLTDEFIIDRDLRGVRGIVVDDVYRSGDTIAGVAQAARRAGAGWLAGLVCARTRRAS